MLMLKNQNLKIFIQRTAIQQHQICHQQEVTQQQVLRKFVSNVSAFLEFLSRYKEYLYQCIRHFRKFYLPTYFCLGRDQIRSRGAKTVQGMKLEFEESPLQGECSGFEILENESMIQNEVN